MAPTYTVEKALGDILNLRAHLEVEHGNGQTVGIVHIGATTARGEHVVELLIRNGGIVQRQRPDHVLLDVRLLQRIELQCCPRVSRGRRSLPLEIGQGVRLVWLQDVHGDNDIVPAVGARLATDV